MSNFGLTNFTMIFISFTGQTLNSRKITQEKTYLAIKVNIPLENKVMHRAIS